MISIIVFIVCINVTFCDESIKYAAVIYRHGDRTPVEPYPTDPWRNESLWPVKFGELTNIGKRQHFALGQWLRKRYSSLLSVDFDPSEIYVRSTDVDRTLMSAQANLAGMYPPYGNSVWDTDLMWQPIPVHTIPEKQDKLLAMKKHCIAYDNELNRLIHSKEYIEKLSKYQSLMDYLSAYTGMKVKNYNDINDIYNTLYIETLYNFTLPNWTLSVYPDKLLEPSGYSFRTKTATPLLARLEVGPLLKEIVSHMVKTSNSTLSNRNHKHLKLSVYSGHDLTIANVLNALGMFDGNCPEYTSTVLLELIFDNSTASHFIRISYKNSTEIIEPYVLNIHYCGKKCPLDRFIKLYENLLTVDWDNECAKQVSQFPMLLGMSFFFGLGIFASIYKAHKVHFAKVTNQYRSRLLYNNVNKATTVPVKVIEA